MPVENYKTLKQLCQEAGLKPIPFIPVSYVSYKKPQPKKEREPGDLRRFECVCGWKGRGRELRKDAYRRIYCPECDSREVYPDGVLVRK